MAWVQIWKISPKNVNFFNFSLRVKKNLFGSSRKVPGSKAGQPLIYCRSKVSLGQGSSLFEIIHYSECYYFIMRTKSKVWLYIFHNCKNSYFYGLKNPFLLNYIASSFNRKWKHNNEPLTSSSSLHLVFSSARQSRTKVWQVFAYWPSYLSGLLHEPSFS